MYCKTCLFPNTKPDINFNSQGICDSCVSAKKKHGLYKSINWKIRSKQFDQILKKSKNFSKNYYNFIVPVSGGKIAHGKFITMKKFTK